MIARRLWKYTQYVHRIGLPDATALALRRLGMANGRFLQPRERQVPVAGLATPLILRDGSSDHDVLEQVFLQNGYESPSATHDAALHDHYVALVAAGETPVIIDCGANVGIAAVWYAQKYPQSRIYAVEPEPENYALLERNVAAFENITPMHAAVASAPGRMSLNNPAGEAWTWQTEPDLEGEVEAITIDSLLRSAGTAACLVVKVDIEGAEVDLFGANNEWLENTSLVVFEPHDWMLPWTGGAEAVLRSMSARGRRDYLISGENVFCYSHSLKQGVWRGRAVAR
jgi:FkbM family methyltransferase